MLIMEQNNIFTQIANDFHKEMNMFTVKDKGEVYIEDIVLNGLIAEMGYPSFDIEAYKAQAVAIRTRIKTNTKHKGTDYDLCGETCCFVLADQKKKEGFTPEQLKRFEQAVKETKGEYIYYKGKLIDSVQFFAYAHNTTNSSDDVWSGGRPYLQAVNTPEKVEPQEVVYTKQEFLNRLNIENMEDLNIKNVNYNGYVKEIEIKGHIFNGNRLRPMLGLKSGNFAIYDEGDNVKLVCYGYGHGVGMSQYGANELAKQGYKYKDILKHYYSGAEIK